MTPWPQLAPEKAVPLLQDHYGARLYQLAVRLCGHSEDAEDLVQDTMLLAFRKWGQFAGDADPGTWLYTIAARACRRKRRPRAGQPQRLESLEELLPNLREGLPDLGALGGDPAGRAVQGDLDERVQRALLELPQAFRLPLVLKDLAEVPIEQVAAVLDLKEATVKTRLHRARLKLRRTLVAGLPQVASPEPDHSRRICLDLLAAKQEAMDKGVELSLPAGELCARCASLFASLDLGREACRKLGQGEPLPERLRRRLETALARERGEASG